MTCVVEMEDEVQFADVFEAAIEGFDEHLVVASVSRQGKEYDDSLG